ncbi:chemotaxis protein CheB [Olivibacter sp. XZL3]|uniref:chemotaxis protein CheB n=1 Tax=Olivibacter sp. XZL3 TaxID=1735116 RepID=UPI0010662B86|nr:chemotaxis protein CheB [Olivibacter sp. XZL3]
MKNQKTKTELLIIACSAGGMLLLIDLLANLKGDVGFAVLVIVHRNDKYQSSLEQMAQMKCKLRVKSAEEKEVIQPGVVYFAPAGYHVLIERNRTVSLDASEPVHYCRPSIDVSMQSAAEVYGSGVIAILLSGANRDGADGMRAVYKYGGITLVQNPADAEIDMMPRAAIETKAVVSILSDEQLKQYCRELD